MNILGFLMTSEVPYYTEIKGENLIPAETARKIW